MLKGLAAIVAATVAGVSLLAAPAPSAQTDLDAFMQKVLARRDENWKKLQQYVLDERELVSIRGGGTVPIWGERREYTWFLREGFFVRSPLKINGVTVAEAERRKYEEDYLRRAKERDTRRGRGGPPPQPSEAGADTGAGTADTSRGVQNLIVQVRQPEFIDSAYFLRFKFEEAKYALVGHETFEGRDVLRIEYYPTRLFSHEQDQQRRRDQKQEPNRDKDVGATLERMMNKVSLITIWVEPKSYQIVKYTFDNVNFDFLPVAWLLRVDAAKASMTMSQPFADVWLPRDVDTVVGASLAVGSFDIHYHLDYSDYREAKTSSRIKTPLEAQ